MIFLKNNRNYLWHKMIKSIQLFVVWMIQTKKRYSKDRKRFHNKHDSKKNRKHQKNRKTNFLLLKSGTCPKAVCRLDDLKPKEKQLWIHSLALFHTKTSLFGSKNALIKEPQSYLCCIIIQSVRLFVVWMVQTKKQTATRRRRKFHNRKILQKNRKHQKNRKTNFLLLKSGRRDRAVCRLDDSKPNEKQLFTKWMPLFNTKNYFVRFQKRSVLKNRNLFSAAK